MGDLEITALRRVFEGRKVLVTGHTGFKGSWLCQWLLELGAEIAGLALPPDSPDGLFSRLGLAGRLKHVVADVRDFQAMAGLFADFRPEVVFHLAAQPLVRVGYRAPKGTFDVNLSGTVNILEAVRTIPSVRALVCITTDKCYRNREWTWGYRENDELGGTDPYSASKAACEIAFEAYARSYFDGRSDLGASTARAGNVIGGGDFAADRIMPDCIRALAQGRPVILRKPEAVRPWQHVLDPLAGYLLLAVRCLADPKRFSGSYNFAPDIAACRTVEDLARKVAALWGGGEVRVEREAEAPHETTLLRLSADKARLKLDWHPRLDYDRALAQTVSWYRAVHDGADATALTKGQILAYMESCHD